MKVPTKHGLDRKFKPWRKGKSAKSNKRSSLKQQLRGQERLLAKLGGIDDNGGNKDASPTEDSAQTDRRRLELQERIASLKREIEQKQQITTEKTNAERAHGQRFLDRQRLVREERKVRKEVASQRGSKGNAATEGNNDEDDGSLSRRLLRLALDQVYVAHHPNDVKYMALYKRGKRVVDQSRQLYRRAVTRKRILRDLAAATTDTDARPSSPTPASTSAALQRVTWISDDQYRRLPQDWTIQDEERVFGGSISRSSNSKTSKVNSGPEDSRFAAVEQHDAVLEAAEMVEKRLKETEVDEYKKVGSLYDEEDSDDADDASEGRMVQLESGLDRNQINRESNDSSSSDSSDASSIGEEDRDIRLSSTAKGETKAEKTPDSLMSSSSSSSSSEESSSDDDDVPSPVVTDKTSEKSAGRPAAQREVVEEEIDDFLVDVDPSYDDHNIFQKTTKQVPALSDVRGNKSRGWETQKQRPGEFKKRRTRW